MSLRPMMLVIATVASTSQAMPLEPRQISFRTECDGARSPDWNTCESAFAAINEASGGDAYYQWQLPENYPNVQSVWYWGDDCGVAIYWQNGQPIQNNLVVDAINVLESQCKSYGAGGIATNNDGSITRAVSIFGVASPPAKRDAMIHAPKQKRQDAYWTNAYTIYNSSPREYWQQLYSALPGGSSWSLTDSQTQTNTFQSTTEISADLFSIFSASQSISFGFEDSYTTSITQTIPNNCANDQTGYLYWAPLFTQYHGGFSGGPSPADLYVPLASADGNAAGNYEVECDN